LVEALVRQACEVRAFVLYNSFNSWGWLDRVAPDVAGKFQVIAGDIRDPHMVETAVRGCNVVMHLAALIAIPYSYVAPDSYVETNVRGTLNVVQAARTLGIERVVCTSTSEVYGTARYVPIAEDHPLQAQSPYSATKIAADAMALSFHAAFGTPVTVLRPFNTYGPRQSTRAVIPTIIGQIATGKRCIELGALTPTRDFTYVEDTARGFIHAAACDAIIGQVTNIGSGFEVSIGETANLIAELMNRNVEIVCKEERLRPKTSEVERLFADVDKAKRLFHWKPEHGGPAGFRKGLAKTVEWFTQAANLAHYKMDRYTL
jgi:dTDP-glucose 4,6-dehydratase